MADSDPPPAPLRDEPANRRLVSAVRPAGWPVPEPPAAGYDLVVIGGGTAGLVAAHGAAGLGARVALVERHLLGGECLNAGCVPSKALLAEAHRVHATGTPPDAAAFTAAMTAARAVRADMAPHDSAARLREAGIDVYFGQGRFEGPERLAASGRSLRFGRAILATGARDRVPPIDGIEAERALGPAEVFELTERPARLVILGGGAVGCELAQAFARLGSIVTLVERAETLLPDEEPDAGRLVAAALADDGVRVLTATSAVRAEPTSAGTRLHLASADGGEHAVEGALFLAAGRLPALDGLGLGAAGVAVVGGRPVADDHLQTTNRRIFVAGDVSPAGGTTHAADATARLAVQNALFVGRKRASLLTLPRAVYTAPEVATVGLSPEAAAALGTQVVTYEQPMVQVDRARLDGTPVGFLRVHVARGSDRIVGATAVAAGAGELIALVTLAVERNIGLQALAALALPYPTRAQALTRVADQYMRARLTPPVRGVLRAWFAARRLGRPGTPAEEPV